MPSKNDNWKVSLVRDREHENAWTVTAKRAGFEHTQRVAGNEGEITEFCKAVRLMYKQHVSDQERAAELAEHFDTILEREDERETFEAQKAAEEKIAADAAAARQAELDQKNAELKAKLEAEEAEKKAKADLEVQTPETPAPDAPLVEESNDEQAI